MNKIDELEKRTERLETLLSNENEEKKCRCAYEKYRNPDVDCHLQLSYEDWKEHWKLFDCDIELEKDNHYLIEFEDDEEKKRQFIGKYQYRADTIESEEWNGFVVGYKAPYSVIIIDSIKNNKIKYRNEESRVAGYIIKKKINNDAITYEYNKIKKNEEIRDVKIKELENKLKQIKKGD